MFGRSFFSDFHDDPFFSGAHDHFGDMESTMNSFFGGMRDEFPALPYNSHRNQQDHGESRVKPKNKRQNELSPFSADPFGVGGFGGLFSGVGKMFDDLHRQMELARNDPNAFSYSQSSVMTYSNTGEGEPKIYQATTSTRQGPGGIRETRKAVRDSVKGIERSEFGHHLDGRSKIVEKEIDLRTGKQSERSDLVGLREDELASFEEDWRRRTRQSRIFGHALDPRETSAALTDGRAPERVEKKTKKGRKTEYYVEEA